MREKIVAGNWKMNKTFDEGLQLVNEVLKSLKQKPSSHTTLICPPYLYLKDIAQLTNTVAKIATGAQNVFYEAGGAYTGEVSTGMLKSIHVDYVIIGHSERRELFSETNATVLKKINAALAEPLKVIFCCGEPQSVRESGQHETYILNQLEESIFTLNSLDNIVIAYEPIWAIGTGLTASPQQAQEMHRFIRQQVANRFSDSVAQQVSILYGGSCKPDNAAELFSQADVDGGLIGGASLKADDFLSIIYSL